nr:outer membrane beta-barrel protein [Oricola nitratireducens]
MKILRHSLTAILAVGALGASLATASAGDGYYIRGELGGSWSSSDTATWTTPGGEYQMMDLNNSGSFAGGIAVGTYVKPYLRTDFSYTYLGNFDLDSCKIPRGNATCGESHNTGTVNSHLFMLNGYLEKETPIAVGTSMITPFLTAGIGAALHDFGTWNHMGSGLAPQFATTGRNFEGKNKWDFAWTLGAGVSVDMTKTTKRPMFLDVTYRFTDAGTAQGSDQPLPGNGNGIPQNAYSADIVTHSVFVGLRIPFGR